MEKKYSILDKLVASFDNSAIGFSARKLSAFISVTVAIVATFVYVDEKVITNTLIIWLTFALLCLGIITAEQVLRYFKDSNDSKDTSTPSENQPDPKI